MCDTITRAPINIFKEHIANTPQYVGGSTRDEVRGTSTKIYKLSSNENMLGPSPKAVAAIKEHVHSLHEYSYQHDGVFRQALAEFHGAAFSPGQFITGNSGLELIELIVRAFLDPGLECILSTPTFLAYKNFAELQGAKVIDVPLDREDFYINAEGILDAVTPKTRILFLSNPNNPTGSLIPRIITDKIIYSLPDHVVVVYDEVYHHYTNRKDYAMADEYIARGKNVIGLQSFSKAYGLAGLRLGYGYSTPKIASYINRIRRPFLLSKLAVEAGMAALQDHEHLTATKELVLSGKEWLQAKLAGRVARQWDSEANFILLRPLVDHQIFSRVLLERGVMVRTTEPFGLRGHIRVTVGTAEANEAFISNMAI